MSGSRGRGVRREVDREEHEFEFALAQVSSMLDDVRVLESAIREVCEGKRDESLNEARQREVDYSGQVDELHRQRERYRLARNAFRRDPRAGEKIVAPGSVVSLYFDDTPAQVQTLVVTERHDDTEFDTVGPRSALGAALLWHRAGDVVEFETPSGHQRATLLLVTPGFRCGAA